MLGSSVSLTVTDTGHVSEFPEGSVAVNCTVLEPTGNLLPLAGPDVWLTIAEQLSVAVAEGEATAPQTPGSLLRLMFEEQDMSGRSLSVTEYLQEQVSELPALSETEYLTSSESVKQLPDDRPAVRDGPVRTEHASASLAIGVGYV